MMRASTSSKPTELLWSLISRYGPKCRRRKPALLACMTLLVAVVSTSASTILFSNLGEGWYPDALQNMPVRLDYGGKYLSDEGTSFINTKPDVTKLRASTKA